MKVSHSFSLSHPYYSSLKSPEPHPCLGSVLINLSMNTGFPGPAEVLRSVEPNCSWLHQLLSGGKCLMAPEAAAGGLGGRHPEGQAITSCSA